MELKEFFLKQLAYNDAMNLTMLHKLKELEHPPLEVQKLLSHIAMAQILWLNRVYGNSLLPNDFAEVLSFPELEDKLRSNHLGWLNFFDEIDEEGLNNKYAY